MMEENSQPQSGGVDLSTNDDIANALMSKWDAEDASSQQEETPEESKAEEVVEQPKAKAKATEPEAEEQSDVEDKVEEDSQALDFGSIYELAEALEVQPEVFLETIKGKVKVDGEESEISLKEALSGYQRQADYHRKTQELAEQRRQAEAEYGQQMQELQQRAQIAEASLQAANNALMQEFQGIDWNELESTDPGTAALYRQKFQQRQGEIQNYFNQLVQQRAQQEQIAEQQRQENLHRFTLAERDKLKAIKSDWDGNTSKQVQAYMQEQGFTPEEIGTMVDHRAALMAWKAMQFDKQKTSVDVAKAKVKSVPKVLKPNSKTRKNANAEKVKNLRSKLKKTGSVHDAAAILLERMG